MEFLEMMLENIANIAILLFEFIGVGIIIWAGIVGFYKYLRKCPDTRIALAKGLVMGLEFKMGKRDPENGRSPGMEGDRPRGGDHRPAGPP